MARHGRRPRPSSGIEKAADRQGWRATSVTHTASHIHNALSRASPVLTHFSLTARSSLTHTHRFLGFRNSTPDILLSVFSVRLTTLLRVSVRRVEHTPSPSPCPHSSLTHTHRFLGSRNSTPDILTVFSVRLTTLLRVSVSRVACAPAPSSCPRSSLTHAHTFLGSHNSTTGNLPSCSVRLLCILCVPDDRDSACLPSPSLSPRSARCSHIQIDSSVSATLPPQGGCLLLLRRVRCIQIVCMMLNPVCEGP